MTGFRLLRKVPVLALLLLGGCQIVPGGAAPRPAPVAEAGPVAQDPTPAARRQVALLVPLSGTNAGVGTSIRNAAQLALADAGEGSVNLLVFDTAALGAEGAARRALDAGARLFLGPLTAEDARAVAPVARQAGVPVVTFSNDRTVAGGGVYLLGFTPEQSVRRSIASARGEGARRFSALFPANEYGARARAAFEGAVRDAGGEIAGVETYERTSAGLADAVARLGRGPAADAVLIADTGAIARAAAPALKRGPLRGARLLGTELWGNEDGLGRTPALVGARFAAVPDAMFDSLERRYRERTGRTPYRLGSLGYDATLLAVRVSRDWRAGTAFPGARLLDASGFSGVDGAFRFRPDGTAERALAILEVTPTSERVVEPAATGFGG